MPRILFVDHTAQLGGAELSMLGIAQHFGPGAHLMLFEHGPLEAAAQAVGLSCEVIARPIAVRRQGGLLAGLAATPAVVPLAWRVARAARQADVVYANSQKALVVAAIACRVVGKPLIWHLHDILTAAHFSRTMRATVVRLANAQAARVIVNSEATGRAFVAAGGRGEIARVVYNGIDEARFAGDSETPDEARLADEALAGLPRPIIGVFGRLAPWKAQHVAIWALRVLGRGSLVIVGDALFGETAYRDSLHEQVRSSSLGGRVRLLGHRDDVAALMRRVDVVAHTSIAPEPFGRVIVEAMLGGRPVVATDAGGPAEIIENGVSGLLVPPNSPRALAEALGRVTRDTTLAVRLGRKGREWAHWNFTLARTNPQISAVIDEVVPRLLPAPSAMPAA